MKARDWINHFVENTLFELYYICWLQKSSNVLYIIESHRPTQSSSKLLKQKYWRLYVSLNYTVWVLTVNPTTQCLSQLSTTIVNRDTLKNIPHVLPPPKMLNMSSHTHNEDNKKQVAEKFFIHFEPFPFLLMNELHQNQKL